MTAERPARRLTTADLARAVPVKRQTLDELLEWGFVKPGDDGTFRPSDIQRVRAVMAMRSPGISLDQLVEAFRERLFTLQPMDLLYPEPDVATDTTTADLAAELGMQTQELIRVIIAVGSPAPRPETQLRTDEVELIRLLVDVGRKSGGDKGLLRIARVFGEATRKAADSAVAIFDENINSPVVRARDDDDRRMEVNRLAAELMASSEDLIARLYRRHLEHTLMRFWAISAERFLDELGVRAARAEPPGLAFVDLTGYTRLTEAGGDETAAQLAVQLADLSELASSRHGGRVVKLLGDGAMLHFDGGLDAVRGALALVDLIEASELPPAHAGVHAGPVIERDGDYFGATVNMAARISAQAGAGQVVTSAAVAGAAPADLRFEPLGSRHMKGVGALELFLARRA